MAEDGGGAEDVAADGHGERGKKTTPGWRYRYKIRRFRWNEETRVGANLFAIRMDGEIWAGFIGFGSAACNGRPRSARRHREQVSKQVEQGGSFADAGAGVGRK